ncbi:GyrI-like domain-containing protein [Croceitalea marina]|uniref:GyrI-like domain-containing protein n=1 Tax=Croceitalea marina TaxID=1775166 RepID=A0ABW5MTM1_9FLAO
MKKVILAIGGIIVVTAFWYFFIKSYDYQVNFKAKTFPGAINQVIKAWGVTMEGSEILDQKDITRLTQSLKFGDSTHIYTWKIKKINDSLSQIKVFASDKDYSLKNKLQIPFLDTDFEKNTRKTLEDFIKTLDEHLEKFKVEIAEEESTRTTYCACTELQTSQIGKAEGMMGDFPLLTAVISENNLKSNGPPFLEVINWDKEKDSIQFKFCFPIQQMDTLPEHPEVEYRNYDSRPALKAIYNGNYITSDRAWYALIDYAKENDIKITGLPIEVFHNNPNMGGNELDWKAEIYMPIKVDLNE